jgi:hypothetical protein
MTTKITCSICGNKHDPDFFFKERKKNGELFIRNKARCKACKRKEALQRYHKDIEKGRKRLRENGRRYRSNPDWVSKRKCRIYGIHIEEFYDMYKKQSGRCAICFKEISIIQCHFDHAHEVKPFKLRGVLCRLCNVGLGHFKENISYLESAIQYIKNFNTNIRKEGKENEMDEYLHEKNLSKKRRNCN